MKKTAFTLAEVLITLTIIGVIAALTIPNLMQSYRKHETEVKLKKTYAMLSQAFKMAQTENNLSPDDIIQAQKNGTGNDFLTTYLIPYLKVAKNCISSPKEEICNFPKIKDLSNYNKEIDRQWNAYPRIVLNNGEYIGVWYWPAFSHFMIMIDIDGKKGKNQEGVDMFYFVYNSSGLSTWYSGGWGATCTLNNDWYSAFACTYVIQQNGWRIPDDYPVKKW